MRTEEEIEGLVKRIEDIEKRIEQIPFFKLGDTADEAIGILKWILNKGAIDGLRSEKEIREQLEKIVTMKKLTSSSPFFVPSPSMKHAYQVFKWVLNEEVAKGAD